MTDQGDRLGPPPVEPMSDIAWSRIERGVWTRLDQAAPTVPVANRRWLRIALPALAAAAAVVIAVVALRGTASPELPAPAPLASTEPSRVVSGAAPSSITFADAHIALDAESAVVLAHEGASPATLLERGAAWFTVAPRAERPPFVVRAGDTVVRVIGTRFRVARSDERITVDVDHGLVEVLFRGNTVRVGANQHWSSEQPGDVGATQRSAGVDKPVVDDAVAEKTVTEKPVTQKPVTEKVLSEKPAANAGDADRAAYDRLVAIEARDPAAALAGYLRLSRESGPWAEVALFAAGRLAADRGDRRATTLLTIYLRRFPTGANAADARQLLDRPEGARP